MGIFRRFNTVLRSNLNSLLDRAEDPDKLIAQTVSDMESELKQSRRELVATLGSSKRLAKKAVELEEEAKEWEEKAVLALGQGDEQLAREALRRKGRTKRQVEEVRRQSAEQEAAADEMKRMLERIESKMADLRSRQSSLAADVRRARTSPGPESGAGRFGSPTFDELERMSGRIDQLEAEVEASKALGEDRGGEVDARFRALERDTEAEGVEDELAQLKRKLEG